MSDLEVKIDPKEGRILVYCNKAFNDLVRTLTQPPMEQD